jgi:DNA polymerase III epsilon subunit-like protein
MMINPKVPIPYWSSEVHHIYDVDVKNSPYIEEVIDEILWYINNPDIIIWHNIEYDEDVLKIELKRLEREFSYKPKQTFCTMKSSVDFCAIKWKSDNRFKYPKLWELHKKLFWNYFIWAHNALKDVEATLKCYVELVNKWVVKIKENKKEIMSLF